MVYWRQELKALKIKLLHTKEVIYCFNLPSKVNIIKQLINTINGKTIIFGNSLDALLKITPNVVSSKNDEKKNDFIRYNFW